jgi:hypothetical protein
MSAAQKPCRGYAARLVRWRAWLPCAGFAVVLAGWGLSAAAISRSFLYAAAAHDSTVVKVDPDTSNIVATIGTQGEAIDIAAAPNGLEAYVAIAEGRNSHKPPAGRPSVADRRPSAGDREVTIACVAGGAASVRSAAGAAAHRRLGCPRP